MKSFSLALLGAIVGVIATIAIYGGKTTVISPQAPLGSTTKALTPGEIYNEDAPGVLYVSGNLVNADGSSGGGITGSGFEIDNNGDVLTNAHVVHGTIGLSVQFASGQVRTAKILGQDISNDLALIHFDPAGLKLHPLTLNGSGSVHVGDPVAAIGNPFGLDRTLTTGVISALQREITAPNNFSINNVLQTDASINPGNSGGPLINAQGQVIAINSQIETGSSGADANIGIGFAIPIDTAKKEIKQLEHGDVQYAYLGISGTTVNAQLFQTVPGLKLPVDHGVLVALVVPGSPAQVAGIRGGSSDIKDIFGEQIVTGGDIITSVSGIPITSVAQITQLISSHKPGQSVAITYVEPSGQKKTVQALLVARPNVFQRQ